MSQAERPDLLSRVLGLQAGELARVSRFWLVGLLFTAAFQISDGVAQTLFLKRVGVSYLPWMFVLKALLDIAAAALYLPLAARTAHRGTLQGLLLVAAGGLSVLWLASRAAFGPSYPALYAFHGTLATLITIHWGVQLLAALPGGQARRCLPAIYTGGRVGAALGGVALSALTPWWGISNLLPLAVGLFALALAVAGRPSLAGSPLPAAAEPAPVRITTLRAGLVLLRTSPLLRSIALATMLLVGCRYGLRLAYSAIFARSWSEPALGSFFGLYWAAANSATLLLQLTVVPRLLLRSGAVRGTNLGYSLAVLASFLGLAARPALPAAIAARAIETEIKAALKTPLSTLFYAALPVEEQAAARALVLGVVVPLASVATGLTLLGEPTLRVLALAGSGLAALLLAATLLQNRRYRQARGQLPPPAATPPAWDD